MILLPEQAHHHRHYYYTPEAAHNKNNQTEYIGDPWLSFFYNGAPAMITEHTSQFLRLASLDPNHLLLLPFKLIKYELCFSHHAKHL